MFTHGLIARRAAWMRRLAMSLTLAICMTPLAGLTPAQAQDTLTASTPVKSLLLFPASVDTGAGDGAAILAGPLDAAIKQRLDAVGAYSVLSYSRFLPAVRRGRLESDSGGLLSADVQPPFSQPGAFKVAALVGTDAFLLTRILSYSQDAATRRVTLAVTSRAYYSDTGAPVPGLSATVSGTAVPSAASDTDAYVEQGAVNDAAARIASALNATAPQTRVVTYQTHRKSGKGARTILAVAVLGALVYGIISGSHFGGGGNNGSSSGSVSSGGGVPGIPGIPGVP